MNIFPRTGRMLLAAVAVAALSSVGLAQQLVTEGGRTFRLHTVTKGEGLYRLCKDNGVTQEDVISANPGLSKTGLVEGVVIRIPVSGTETSAVATYVVRKGDTAYSIAREHGMSLAKFLELNPDAMSGVREGQVVKLDRAPAEFATHVIAAGETLYSIGVRYGVKTQQIVDANASLNPAALPVGTAIRIPRSSIPQEDDAFFYHRIAAGETLYSLCVKYDILQEKIQEVNEGVDWAALQIGQIVAVPKVKRRQVVYSDYRVGRRETLYSIAREEGVGVDDILAANEGLTADNLKRGMTIRIPHFEELADATPATLDASYVGDAGSEAQWGQDYSYDRAGRPTINVFLMLPFNAYAEMKGLRESGVNTNEHSYPFKSRRYVEFYEGARMALDSLCRAGANICLKVFDTNSRLSAINQLNTASVRPDIIIGPAHRGEMADAMSYARANKTPVVLPFAQCDSSILDNPYVFQASVIDSITGKEVMAQMVRRLGGRNVVVIAPSVSTPADKERHRVFRQMCEGAGVPITVHSYDTSAPTKILPSLKEDTANVVVLPTNSEAVVNSIITSLAGVVEQKPTAPVELWGFSEWLVFQTIEIDVFHKLNTKIFTTYAVDETDPRTAYAINEYRKRYFTEPLAFTPYFQRLRPMSGFSEYGLWGYDVAMKFVGAVVNLGPGFVRNVDAYKPRLLQSNFRFQSLTNWGGAVNVGLKTVSFRPGGDIVVENVD